MKVTSQRLKIIEKYKMKNLSKISKEELKTKTFEELQDKYFGKKGSKERKVYEVEFQAEKIGEFLKQARESMNYSQAQLASKLGIDKSYISKIENNVKSQRVDTIVKVLKALQAKMFIRIEVGNKSKDIELA